MGSVATVRTWTRIASVRRQAALASDDTQRSSFPLGAGSLDTLPPSGATNPGCASIDAPNRRLERSESVKDDLMREQAPWNRYEYDRMVAAEHAEGWLTVSFEDGDRVRVQADRLLPPSTATAQWDRLTFSPYEIAVPTAQEIVVIPSCTVRALTDPEYGAHLAGMAEEQARRIGRRIRALRKARGLTSKDLAVRAGIHPQSLSRIEHGQHDVVFTTLRRILAAMGCSLRDLAVMDEADLEPEPISTRSGT
jgi:DNA-binding Xre family transcriptional regulator